MSSSTRQGTEWLNSTTTYDYGGTWQGHAYALGQVQSVSTQSNRNNAHHTSSATTYTYAFYQSAVQTSIHHTQTNSPAGNTVLAYNLVAGQAVLTTATINDGRSRTVSYHTNLMGEVVRRTEGASGSGGGAPAEALRALSALDRSPGSIHSADAEPAPKGSALRARRWARSAMMGRASRTIAPASTPAPQPPPPARSKAAPPA